MIAARIRKALAEAAFLMFLVTVTPVYAMSELESRPRSRAAQVQMIAGRSRRRALTRRYGLVGSSGLLYQFVA